jgi:hypothetical protein
MPKFALRLVGEDSGRVFETEDANDTVENLAKRVIERGYLLGKMKTTERLPEPQEVALMATQIKWISPAQTR